jgi:ubiquitin-protein ligase E3 C
VPGGASIPVTKRNRLQYIYLLGSMHLDRSIARQCDAFRRGLFAVLPQGLLKMFAEPELQVSRRGVPAVAGRVYVVTGRVAWRASDTDFGILGGLRRRGSQSSHTVRSTASASLAPQPRHPWCVVLGRYTGGYTSVSPTIKRFWAVVESLEHSDVAALLKFVTACERPPPRGFQDLHPPFCIQRVRWSLCSVLLSSQPPRPVPRAAVVTRRAAARAGWGRLSPSHRVHVLQHPQAAGVRL